MVKPVKRMGRLPQDGTATALAVLSAAFFLGGLLGCILASRVGGGSGGHLTAYLERFLQSAQRQTLPPPSLLLLLWETVRWPILVLLLGLTSLGLAGIPLVFLIRGFLLSFSIASFIRIFGVKGCLLAFFIFGIAGLCSVPALFLVGTQGLVTSRWLVLRLFGEGRHGVPDGRRCLLRLGVCAVLLCCCVCVKAALVPALVRVGAELMELPDL